MELKILNVRLLKNGKPLKAFADIQLSNGWIIKDFRIIQQPEQKAYVVAPQTAWKGPQGKPNFKPIISMPNAVKWQLESAILTEYQKAKEETNEKTT